VTLNTIFLKLSKYNHGNQLLKTAKRMEASNMIKIGGYPRFVLINNSWIWS